MAYFSETAWRLTSSRYANDTSSLMASPLLLPFYRQPNSHCDAERKSTLDSSLSCSSQIWVGSLRDLRWVRIDSQTWSDELSQNHSATGLEPEPSRLIKSWMRHHYRECDTWCTSRLEKFQGNFDENNECGITIFSAEKHVLFPAFSFYLILSPFYSYFILFPAPYFLLLNVPFLEVNISTAWWYDVIFVLRWALFAPQMNTNTNELFFS